MDSLWYSTRSMPAHRRVGAYVADTAPLGLLFKLVHDVPAADPYLVGGTVRDAILGVTPHRAHILVRDVAPPLLNKFLNANGTVTQHTSGHWHVTPRGTREAISVSVPHIRTLDHSGTATRIPAHERSLHDDLAARDFSVNAMAYSLKDGILHDPHGGLNDMLNRKTIRTLHHPELHLSQEPALASRAIRLASQYNLTFDQALWNAIPRHHGSVHRTSHDDEGNSRFVIPRVRLGHDVLMALAQNPKYALTLLKDSGALESLAPEMLQHGATVHDDGETGWQKTHRLLDILHHHDITRAYGTAKKSATLYLAGLLTLLDDRAMGALRDIVTRLHLHAVDDHRLHFDHTDAGWMLNKTVTLTQGHATDLSPAERERLVRGQRGAELLALLDATVSAKHEHGIARENLVDLRNERDRWLNNPAPEELVRGRDLLALNFSPGPQLRSYLDKIRSAQLNGHLSSRAAALDFARYLSAQNA